MTWRTRNTTIIDDQEEYWSKRIGTQIREAAKRCAVLHHEYLRLKRDSAKLREAWRLTEQAEIRQQQDENERDRIRNAKDQEAHANETRNSTQTESELLRRLIAEDEGQKLEFKQSLEYVDPKDPRILNAPEQQRPEKLAIAKKEVVKGALKTICGFVNSDGGTLLIGVQDQPRNIIGIEPDLQMVKGKSNDRFELKLRSMVKERIEPDTLGLIAVKSIDIDGKTVCQVDVKPDRTPRHLDDDVFVRDGNETQHLKGPKLTRWITRRSSP